MSGTSKNSLKMWLMPLLCLSGAGFLSVAFICLAEYRTDDAYIHFRIARNYIEWGQPFFNRDEAVMATSSPLWTLLLSAIWALFGTFVAPVAIVNALSVMVVFYCCYNLSREVTKARLTAGLSALGCSAALVLSAIQQMETAFALALCCSGILLLRYSRIYGIAFIALSCSARFELAVVLIGSLFWCTITKRLVPGLMWAFVGLIIPGAWMLSYFGSIVPHTIIAKEALYHLAWHETLALMAFEFLGKRTVLEQPLFVVVYLSTVLFCGWTTLFQRKQPASNSLPSLGLFTHLLFTLPGVAIVLTYLLKHVFVFPWYAPLYTVLLLLPLVTHLGRFNKIGRLLVAVLLLTPLLRSAAQDLLLASSKPQYFSDFETGAKTRHYLAVAEQLQQRYPNRILLASEIGALGYNYHGTIADAAGLASPEAVPLQAVRSEQEKAMHGSIPVEYIRQVNPELIVGLDLFVADFAHSDLVKNYHWERQPVFLMEDQQRSGLSEFQQSKFLNIFVRSDLFSEMLPGSSVATAQ